MDNLKKLEDLYKNCVAMDEDEFMQVPRTICRTPSFFIENLCEYCITKYVLILIRLSRHKIESYCSIKL